jgi:hypothetical protein
MIDGEVIRLRRLRAAALKTRALASAMDRHQAEPHSALSRGAQSCWRIARVATGTLRAHPYLSYQRGPSAMRAAYDHASSVIVAAIARYRGRTMQTFAAELRRFAHEVDDARALTWSAELSDTLGRSQEHIRRLLGEFDSRARQEVGSHREPMIRVDALAAAIPKDAPRVAGNWPYMAF